MFSTVIIELHFVITSVWRSWIIGMFLFLFVNANMTICVVSLISVICTYMNLRAGNWRWWWRAFFNGATVGLWVFLYMMWMMITEFKFSNFASDLVYMTWGMVAAILVGSLCGAVSLLSSWFFVTVLYMQSKSD